MIAAEDILAAIAGHSQWFDTTRTDKRQRRYRKLRNTMHELEIQLLEYRGLDPDEIREMRRRRPPPRLTADGRQSRTRATAGGLQDVITEALAGMPALYWAAIMWTVASDKTAYDTLYTRLLARARTSQARDPFWPKRIERGRAVTGHKHCDDYVLDLVYLALMELRAPATLDSRAAKADWFGISREHWWRIVERPYSHLQAQTFLWFGSGCSHIWRRLNRRRRDLAKPADARNSGNYHAEML